MLALRVELYLILLADAAIKLEGDAIDCSEAKLEVEVMVWTFFLRNVHRGETEIFHIYYVPIIYRPKIFCSFFLSLKLFNFCLEKFSIHVF